MSAVVQCPEGEYEANAIELTNGRALVELPNGDRIIRPLSKSVDEQGGEVYGPSLPRECMGYVIPNDVYSRSDGRVKSRLDQPPGSSAVPIMGEWDPVFDTTLPEGERLGALMNRMIDEPDHVKSTVLRELDSDANVKWRDTLVLFVERMFFVDPKQREALTNRLLQIASKHREAGQLAGVQEVAESAIRTASSMIDLAQVERLLPFLEPPTGNIDTRLVVLQSLVNIYEAQPVPSAPVAIRDRVEEIASHFLSPESIMPGLRGAIGCKAIQAMAAMADARLQSAVERVIQTDINWLRDLVRQSLSGLNSRRAQNGLNAIGEINDVLSQLD